MKKGLIALTAGIALMVGCFDTFDMRARNPEYRAKHTARIESQTDEIIIGVGDTTCYSREFHDGHTCFSYNGMNGSGNRFLMQKGGFRDGLVNVWYPTSIEELSTRCYDDDSGLDVKIHSEVLVVKPEYIRIKGSKEVVDSCW